MESDFIKLTRNSSERSIIIHANDIVNVTDEGDYRIVRYMLDGHMELEHIKNTIDDICVMLTLLNDKPICLNKKHLNS